MLTISFKAKLNIVCLAVLFAGSFIANSTVEGATYYIRPDGGTAEQCDGTANISYPGSGANQVCAWRTLFTAVKNDKSGWRFNGGDTLVFASGSHRIGWESGIPWCSANNIYGCKAPGFPSGTEVAPTMIVGEGWDSKVAVPPEIWGSEGESYLLNLRGSSNVQVRYLNLTDHSNCEFRNAHNPEFACKETKPFGDWAMEGIVAEDSSNVLLKELDIHGMAHNAIVAARLKDWVVEDVRMRMNAFGGFKGVHYFKPAGTVSDTYVDDINRGTIRFTRVDIEFNGCAESATGTPEHCWAGDGDGFGLGFTCGNWIIEDSNVSHNTSDGLDLLYVRKADGNGNDICQSQVPPIPSSVTIRNVTAIGNAGNQIKTGGETYIENVFAEGNCSYFYNNPIAPLRPDGTQSLTHCRGFGNTISVSPRWGTNVTVVNSTLTGEGDNAFLVACANNDPVIWRNDFCNADSIIKFVNNIVYGYDDWQAWLNSKGGIDKQGFVYSNLPEVFTNSIFDYNILHNLKYNNYAMLDMGMHNVMLDPLFVDSGSQAINNKKQPPHNVRLQSGSPAIGAGIAPGELGIVPCKDIDGVLRDLDHATSGAYEFDKTPPTVKIINPNNGKIIIDSTEVQITASDNDRIEKIELYLDNLLIAELASAPYIFNWNAASYTEGDYNITAKAFDATGNSSISDIITVMVSKDKLPPVVSIANLINGSTVKGKAEVKIEGYDNVGINAIELYVNEKPCLMSYTDLPFSFTWDSLSYANGSYILFVKAYDAAGNVGYSAIVTVTVSNDSTTPTVSISSQANMGTVNGTVTFSAAASDNVEVTKVAFFVNGALQTTAASAPYNFSWNTATLANGSYTLTAKAYDAAGNIGQSAAVTVTVFNDKVAPTVSISSPASGAILSGTASITVTASDNVGVAKVEFHLNGALQNTATSAPYNFSWNTTTVDNGTYTLTAKAYDAADNMTQSSPVSVQVFNLTLDITAPTVSISSPANNGALSGSVTINAAASDNVAVTKVEFFLNGELQATDTNSPYSFSLNTTSFANGVCTLIAKAYDTAGNIGQSAAVAVTVFNDTTAPTAAITAPAANDTIGGMAMVTGTASDNVGVSKVEFYVDGTLQATSTVAPYNFNWNTATLANGTYTLIAKAYDAAGNIGQSPAVSMTVFNDTSAPTVSISSPANGATLNGTATVSATASDNVGVTKVELYVNGVLQATDTSNPYSFNLNTTALANDINILMAKAYDAAGNIGQSAAVTVTVFNDTTAPTVSISSPANGATMSGTAIISATASDIMGVTKVEFYVNGALQATNSTAPYSFNWNTVTLANGTYTLSAKAYDEAGNIGQSSAVTVTVFNDTTASTVAITSPAANSTVSGAAMVTVSATDNVSVSKVEFYVNGAPQATSTANPYNFNWNTATLVNGTYILIAKAYDSAGNIGQSSAVTVTVFNDTAAPTVSISSPASGATLSGTATVTAAASDNVGVTKVEFYLNGALQTTDTSSPFSFSLNTTTLANDVYTLMAKAYDAAGNVGQSSAVSVTVNNLSQRKKIKGDVNNDGLVTTADALIVLRKAVKSDTSADIYDPNADVAPLDASGQPAGDGVVDVSDALTILRKSVGMASW